MNRFFEYRFVTSLMLLIALASIASCQTSPSSSTGASTVSPQISDEQEALERERLRVMRELAVLDAELSQRENEDVGPTLDIAAAHGQEGSRRSVQPARRNDRAWFFDLNTNQLFVDDVRAIPPITAPSGPRAGVRAYVFTCGDCNDAKQRFIGYLETYTPDAARQLADARRSLESDPQSVDYLMVARDARAGRLIRRPNDADWTPAHSEAGVAIITSLARRCPQGTRIRPCLPPVKETEEQADD